MKKLIGLFVFLLLLVGLNLYLDQFLVQNANTVKNELVIAPSLTQAPSLATATPSQAAPVVKGQAPLPDWSVTKLDDKTTLLGYPADSRMATSEELFVEMNNYRTSHGVGAVSKHSTLCDIAQKRADELQALGKLDYHAGMDKYAYGQKDFNNLDEIIGGGVQPNLAVHIIEWGWGRSETGHKQAMEKPQWTHGCGGISGYFHVFIFGAN